MQLSYFPACGAEPPRESALLPPRPEFGRVGTCSHLREGLAFRACI